MIEWYGMAGRNCGLTQFLAGWRSRFVQRAQILRSAPRSFEFGGSFLPITGAYPGVHAQLLCDAQQLSECKFGMRAALGPYCHLAA